MCRRPRCSAPPRAADDTRPALSPAARQTLDDLAADLTLVANILAQLEDAAADLPGRTVCPPPPPNRQDRRLAAFHVEDGGGRLRGVDALFLDRTDVAAVTVIRVGPPDQPTG
jgi:hypothetical protein